MSAETACRGSAFAVPKPPATQGEIVHASAVAALVLVTAVASARAGDPKHLLPCKVAPVRLCDRPQGIWALVEGSWVPCVS